MLKAETLMTLLLIVCLLAACTAPTTPATEGPGAAEEAIISAAETSVAGTATAFFAAPTASLTATWTAVPSETPTVTVTPSETPTPTPDVLAFKKTAKILVYTDGVTLQSMLNSTTMVNYVTKALDAGGYHYVDTTGKVGDLKKQLKAQQWDVILISAESRASVQGEFYEMLRSQLRNGAAVVLETWILDKVDDFPTLLMLDDCGVEVQSDYQASSGRAIQWADASHGLATRPNESVNLGRSLDFWEGDIGDLLKLTPNSQATIVASLNGSKQEQGTLVVCYDNRLVLQTFSSHDHFEEDMVALWQNYTAYALQQRLDYLNRPAAQNGPQQTLEAQKQAAKILSYGGSTIAMNELGLTYQTVVGVGNLRKELERQPWDLVIVGGTLGGDVLGWLTSAREAGASFIIVGDLSKVSEGYLKPFLKDCGVEREGDLKNGIQERIRLGQEHPIFQKPYLISTAPYLPLMTRNNAGTMVLAEGAGGTLWRTVGDHPATLLASLDGSTISGGVTVLCSDERMLIHSVYSADQMFTIRLWENYLTYMLEARLKGP